MTTQETYEQTVDRFRSYKKFLDCALLHAANADFERFPKAEKTLVGMPSTWGIPAHGDAFPVRDAQMQHLLDEVERLSRTAPQGSYLECLRYWQVADRVLNAILTRQAEEILDRF